MSMRVARVGTEPLWTKCFHRTFHLSTLNSTPPSISRIPSRAIEQTTLQILRHQRFALSRRIRFLRPRTTSSKPQNVNPTPHLGSPPPASSLSQRLKQLSREYGWAAVGVYLALSVLDFPICFLAVRLLGTDRIGHYEDMVKNAFWNLLSGVFPNARQTSAGPSTAEEIADEAAKQGNLGADGLVTTSDTGANATIWTQLGLAYLVHKSLIFFRVPLAAAVLPTVVKTLRRWGYNIGKGKPKPIR